MFLYWYVTCETNLADCGLNESSSQLKSPPPNRVRNICVVAVAFMDVGSTKGVRSNDNQANVKLDDGEGVSLPCR
jgi:hypothetical protein